jgi:hypothetical protein
MIVNPGWLRRRFLPLGRLVVSSSGQHGRLRLRLLPEGRVRGWRIKRNHNVDELLGLRRPLGPTDSGLLASLHLVFLHGVFGGGGCLDWKAVWRFMISAFGASACYHGLYYPYNGGITRVLGRTQTARVRA